LNANYTHDTDDYIGEYPAVYGADEDGNLISTQSNRRPSQV